MKYRWKTLFSAGCPKRPSPIKWAGRIQRHQINPPGRVLGYALLCWALLQVCGCVSVDARDLPYVESVPPLPANHYRPNVSVLMRDRVYENGETSALILGDNVESITEELRASGYFGALDLDPQEAEPDLELQFEIRRNTDFPPFMCYLSVASYIFPCITKFRETQEVVARRPRSGRTASYRYTDGVTVYQNILLLPLMPLNFRSRYTRMGELRGISEGYFSTNLRNNLVRHVLLDLQRDGFLDPDLHPRQSSDAKQASPVTEDRPTVSLAVTSRRYFNGKLQDDEESPNRYLTRRVALLFEESGHTTQAAPRYYLDNAQLHVEILFAKDFHASFWGFWPSVLSLGLIPGWGTDEFTVEADITRCSDGHNWQVKIFTSKQTFFHLIPALFSSTTEAWAAENELFRDLIADMAQQGIFRMAEEDRNTGSKDHCAEIKGAYLF